MRRNKIENLVMMERKMIIKQLNYDEYKGSGTTDTESQISASLIPAFVVKELVQLFLKQSSMLLLIVEQEWRCLRSLALTDMHIQTMVPKSIT